MGWVRALKGHVADISDVKYKEGDEEKFQLFAQTTDKILLFASDGRFYTLSADKLPRGKAVSEPIRLMLDMENDVEIVSVLLFKEADKLLVAASNGKGFIVESADVIAQTRSGKQALNLVTGSKAAFCKVVDGDHVAVIGDNRKMLLFPITQIPPMKKGQGVTLQKYKEGGMSDVKTFTLKDGLSWQLGGRIRTELDLKPWLGNRADAGRLPPTGFPRDNVFGI
jgi:topoisomerase-4 subunit A